MTSRIHIGRPVAPSFNADPHGFSNSRSSSGAGYRAANPDDPLEKLRVFAKQVEDAIEVYSQPFRPHLPAIGRFLIVVTFYEDALRIVTQWSDQLWYLQTCVSRFSPPPLPQPLSTATDTFTGVYPIFSCCSTSLYVSFSCLSRSPSVNRDYVGHAGSFLIRDIEAFHGIRSPRPLPSRHLARLRLWPHLRLELFPPKPQCDRWSRYGVQ